jgi:hypothetical protein
MKRMTRSEWKRHQDNRKPEKKQLVWNRITKQYEEK